LRYVLASAQDQNLPRATATLHGDRTGQS
jgi:hypothetical protein